MDDVIDNPAKGDGQGAIHYHSSNPQIASVDSKGTVIIKQSGTVTIDATIDADSAYSEAHNYYEILAVPRSILINAWIGANDAEINFPDSARGIEFFRSRSAECEILDYLNCLFGQYDIISAGSILDTASTLSQKAYYVLQHGTQKATISQSALFSARISYQTAFFKNKIWLIGGVHKWGAFYYNDVWSSVDGSTWVQQIEHAAFSPRAGHQVFVFNNKLWLVGGRTDFGSANKNDIWSSDDGITWKLQIANAEFTAREDHQIVVRDSQIFLIGGFSIIPSPASNLSFLNDVWTSMDGMHWARLTRNANFSPREGHQSFFFKNKLWVIGGASINGLTNDIWSSNDGITWNEENDNPAFSQRYNHEIVAVNNQLILIGGESTTGSINDVWSSSDGIQWISLNGNPGFDSY